jgi:hypothetical protein
MIITYAKKAAVMVSYALTAWWNSRISLRASAGNMDMKYTDAQIERIGTARFVERLYRENIKVSYPDIDDGVDIIAYQDRISIGDFRAVPIQLKCYRQSGFYTDEKYFSIANLFIVYLWNVTDDANFRMFCMPYEKAEQIVNSRSWKRDDKGRCAKSSETGPLLASITTYETTSLYVSLFGHKKPD